MKRQPIRDTAPLPFRADPHRLRAKPHRHKARGALLIVTRISLTTALALLLALAAGLSGAAPASAASRPIVTGFTSGGDIWNPATADLAGRRVRDAGARTLLIGTDWSTIAPTSPPPGFDAANPADPSYDWTMLDSRVRTAVKWGLTPLIQLAGTPAWATDYTGPAGTNAPRPGDLGRFALAAARRYSGSFGGLPRVRYWHVYNEPNSGFFFTPQREGDRARSPGLYRAMVQYMAGAVKSVHEDNLIVAGELFPFDSKTGSQSVGPQEFARTLLCLPGGQDGTDCGGLPIDVFSVHPYTQGSPAKQAFGPTGVSLGDLPEMKALLDQAVALGKVRPRGPLQFWVTELSYDSNPPDPKGVPLNLQRRWTAEAIFRSWLAGATNFVWFLLRDQPRAPERSSAAQGTSFDSGLYFRCKNGPACDTPKPALQAFRFPFVAYVDKSGRVSIWGRTPTGTRATVRIEQKRKGGYRKIATVKADGYGIFQRKIRPPKGRRGALRARASSGTSPPFSLKVPAEVPVEPFGS